MLQDERKRVHGYVDALSARISSQSQPALTTKSGSEQAQPKTFEEQVRDLMGNSKVDVSEDVKSLVERTFHSEDLMRRIRPVVEPSEDVKDEFEEALQAAAERDRKLLERKGKKADYGFEVAKEIRELLEGSKKLK